MVVSIPERLGSLRRSCDNMGIKWHPRHKESTLEALVKEKTVRGTVTFGTAKTVVTEAAPVAPEPEREQRPIPQDVLDALDYCNGYHRGNTKCIRAYIDEIR